MVVVAPYGSWQSPITADLIAGGSVGLGQIALDGDDVYWVEMRPAEGGRMVVVRRGADGVAVDVTPAPYNVRTRVHEYGGGAFLVQDGVVFFANFSDQRIYRQEPGGAPRAITPEGPLRYADGVFDAGRGRIICVREAHPPFNSPPEGGKEKYSPADGGSGECSPADGGYSRVGGGSGGCSRADGGDSSAGGGMGNGGEAVNAVVGVDAGGGGVVTLFEGADFCAAPRLSPDGGTLAWLVWDHPNMPWDSTTLLAAPVGADGLLGAAEVVAGDGDSVLQPLWSPSGELHFVSDRNGWWNLYRWRDGAVEPVLTMEAEFARPQWVFDPAAYGFLEDGRIVCSYVRRGVWGLGVIDADGGGMERLDLPWSEMGRGELRAAGRRAVFSAGAPDRAMSVVSLDADTGATEVLREAHSGAVGEGYISLPEAVEFDTGGGRTAHAFYYAPRNADFAGPAGELPPLLVKSHGGPTAAATTALDLGVQFWTSRGFGVVDVNYGGSVGYGTEYRRRLNGAWGVVDVADCVNAARFLADRGDVDRERLAIDGASAGGYTTLAALTFYDVFRAGASYYGVSDLAALAQETHKFEARYLDSLVGPYPERRDLYRERSPIHYTDRLSCPLLLLQGLEDAIVPPNQAEMMFDAVRGKGIAAACVLFEGEQHGFRRAENIRRALEAELYFYSRVFGFALAEAVAGVVIENLDG